MRNTTEEGLLRNARLPIVLVGILTLVAPAIGVADPTQPTALATPAPADQALRVLVGQQPAARAAQALADAARQRAAAARPDPAPQTYMVQSGDTLWTISLRYGVSVEALAAANRLTLTSILPLGKALLVPPGGTPTPVAAARPAAPRAATAPAVAHVVRSGETLWEIAGRYGVRLEDLMALNDLGHSEWIRPGQRLIVSDRALPRHRQIAAQTRSRRLPAGPTMIDAQALQAAGTLLWPSRGKLTSRFGWRYRKHHEGIDLASPRGTPIHASRDGVVEFAGWKGGYGRVVFIGHGAGLTTVYGHASSLLVVAGQQVKKGQVIARVGCTGVCTGSHVHFEVRINGRAVNPLAYLR